MSHTVTPAAAGQLHRRIARAGLLAASALLAFVLVGCAANQSGGSSADGPVMGEGGSVSEEDAGGEAQGEADRAVVIEGSISIKVDDVDAATGDAVRIVDARGGRIDGREEWRDEQGGTDSATTTMVLRIPADSLDAAIDDLRALGTVESLQTSTTDVTADVQDNDAHIAALASTIARLSSFQDEATSVDDLLAIEQEIAARQAELEGYQTQQADLAERVDYSTLNLSLYSSAPPAGAPDSFWAALGVGWSSFAAFLIGLTIAFGVALPWLLGLGVVAVIVVFVVRWIRRRRPPQPPVAPPGAPGAWPGFGEQPAQAPEPAPAPPAR
jgi:hypothetical protein